MHWWHHDPSHSRTASFLNYRPLWAACLGHPSANGSNSVHLFLRKADKQQWGKQAGSYQSRWGPFWNAQISPMEGKVKAGKHHRLGSINSAEKLFPYLLIKKWQRTGYLPLIFISIQVKMETLRFLNLNVDPHYGPGHWITESWVKRRGEFISFTVSHLFCTIQCRQCNTFQVMTARKVLWARGGHVEALFISQSLVNVSFLGRGVRGECQEGKWITTQDLHQSYPWSSSTNRGR